MSPPSARPHERKSFANNMLLYRIIDISFLGSGPDLDRPREPGREGQAPPGGRAGGRAGDRLEMQDRFESYSGGPQREARARDKREAYHMDNRHEFAGIVSISLVWHTVT